MFDKTNSFFVFEFLEECPPVTEVEALLKERPFADISENDQESDYCYIGPDRIHKEKNLIIHPAQGLLAFSVLFQSRKINKELVEKELERVLAEEYFGQKLSKEDLNLVKENVVANLMGQFSIVYKYSDVILDVKNSRIYVRSSGDGLLFTTLRLLNDRLGLTSTALRPWFNGDFIDKAGGWEKSQTLFLHWLNGVCQKENKYNIFAGTKLDLRDAGSRVKISGDNSKFNGIWDMFDTGRRIDSVHIILKEKEPEAEKNKGEEESGPKFTEVMSYRLSVKKLGFFELKDRTYYHQKLRTPESLNNKVSSLETFISHFDSLCVAFQNEMRSYDMKELYNSILKLEEK